MQIGLLGKTNVGKSTFFSASTETVAQIGNYPFTTIEPNVGIAYARTKCACMDLGLDEHQNQFCVNGTRFIPIKLVDIAGLVPEAHKGKGLGNKFLDDARQADAIIHVVDISGSTDLQGNPVDTGSHDPMEDIEFVEKEFDQWMLQILHRDWQKMTKEAESTPTAIAKVLANRFSGLGVKEHQIEDVILEHGLEGKKPHFWSDEEMAAFITSLRSRAKPVIIAANKADMEAKAEQTTPAQEQSLSSSRQLLGIIDHINQKGRHVVACSAESELLLRKAAKAGLIEYVPGGSSFKIKESSGSSQSESISQQQKNALSLVENNVLKKFDSTGIQDVINKACFDLLKLIVVYPVEDETKYTNKDGDVLPDAKLVPVGSTARGLAYIIHDDLGKGFLYAVDAKTKQRIGADHELNDRDVVKIVSTLSRG